MHVLDVGPTLFGYWFRVSSVFVNLIQHCFNVASLHTIISMLGSVQTLDISTSWTARSATATNLQLQTPRLRSGSSAHKADGGLECSASLGFGNLPSSQAAGAMTTAFRHVVSTTISCEECAVGRSWREDLRSLVGCLD